MGRQMFGQVPSDEAEQKALQIPGRRVPIVGTLLYTEQGGQKCGRALSDDAEQKASQADACSSAC
jgi:hypothetical protein